MTFDIIEITEAEVNELPVVKQKILRTAQQKKDELYKKLQKSIEEIKNICRSNGVWYSTIRDMRIAEATAEYDDAVAVLTENLVYNLSLMDAPSDGGNGGGGDNGSGGDQPDTGYVVDYSLSYLERYIFVRDYYMTIEDPNERLLLYSNDEVALKYLDSYYTPLFNYLITFTQGK